MITEDEISSKVFARGFILSELGSSELSARLQGKPYVGNLEKWNKTFFGPCTLWVDPLLNYARTRDNRFGVGVMGLCINPFDGRTGNQEISDRLHEELTKSRTAFLDYVDQLSGAFVIIYRENSDTYVLQDTAATKPVFYHRTAQGKLTAASHATFLRYIHDLSPDPRVEAALKNPTYKGDPSPYLPGMITAYTDALPLTANHQLEVQKGTSHRFFPRAALVPRPFSDKIVREIADIMFKQAEMIGALGRPLVLAATGGRDSRVSMVTFAGQPNLSYFTFHMPSINHLSDDVQVATRLAKIADMPISVYELEKYGSAEFRKALSAHSPRAIWPQTAFCYLQEFPSNAIHIRSAVSEIGRVFYGRRTAKTVTTDGLAQTYTQTEFSKDPMVKATMQDFIDTTNFSEKIFFNYDLHDMFYWEHRISKWQGILCAEAEMATDVFIPFNNRNLLKLFMSVPLKNRQRADIHVELCRKWMPAFDGEAFI